MEEHPDERLLRTELGGAPVSDEKLGILSEFYEQAMPRVELLAAESVPTVWDDNLEEYLNLIEADVGVVPHGVCALDEVLLHKELWSAPST